MSYSVNIKNNESPSHTHKNYEIHIYIKGKIMSDFKKKGIYSRLGRVPLR